MSWDNVWDEVFKDQEWGKYPCDDLIRFIARNFYHKDRKNIKILEVGCGPGANIWYMSREGFNVYGIDGSNAAIEKAKQRIKGEGLKADLRVGDIVFLPYENSYFDAVIDGECLYANSEQDTRIILSEIKRVLKEKGLFFSRTVADKTYVGNALPIAKLEYKNITEGPLAGKGFVRLATKRKIRELYGRNFRIRSIDRIEHTRDNGAVVIREYSIICQNEK